MGVIGRIEDGASPNCPNLSALFFCSTELHYIPHSFFSKMQGLCTLDLSWNPDMKMIPNSIGDMARLKALLLEGCKKLEIVPYLGKLKAMRELNLSGTAINEVPQGVEELSNLRLFSIDAPASEFSNTLEEISLFGLDDMKVVVQRGETVAAASAVPAQPLFSFLKRLAIINCKKTGKVGLPVSGLPNLEEIHIWECGEIEEIFEEDEGRDACIITILPKLQHLNLLKLPKLKKVGLPVSGVPNLEFLLIEHCREIKEIFQEDVGRNPVTTLPRLLSLRLEDLCI